MVEMTFFNIGEPIGAFVDQSIFAHVDGKYRSETAPLVVICDKTYTGGALDNFFIALSLCCFFSKLA